MFEKRLIMTFIFISFLFIQNGSFALDVVATDLKPTVSLDNQVSNSSKTDDTADENKNISGNDNGTNQTGTVSLQKSEKVSTQLNKTFDLKNAGFNFGKSSQSETFKSSATIPNSRYTIYFRGRAFDLKKHFNLTTLMALIGVFGTFFGLFSTWLIYHLNQKNNNPIIVDKKNSAIKYVDELHRIKIYFANMDIKRYTIEKEEDIKPLIVAYEYLCKNISQVDLISINTRYRKHINKRKVERFNSLISNYKIIKIDGDYLNSNSEDSHIFDLHNQSTPDKLEIIKIKVTLLLAFEQQVDTILAILRKELKLK